MRRVSVATTIMPGYDHVSGLERLRGPVTVIRRCEDLAELISVARSGLADAVLVAGETEQLTRTAIDTLTGGRSGGRALAIVALSAVAEERQRLDGLGIPVAPPEVEADDLAALLLEATAHGVPRDPVTSSLHPDHRGQPGSASRAVPGSPGSVGSSGSRGATGSASSRGADASAPMPPADAVSGADPDTGPTPRPAPRPALPPDPDDTEPHGTESHGTESQDTESPDTESEGTESDDANPAGRSRTTAVWGPAGSPGRTTVAVNLAVELALSGRRTLLVDLDTYAASAGVHLGLLEESAGIAQACRVAEREGVTPQDLGRTAASVRVAGAGLHVLTGLTRSDRWPELRRTAVEDVLAAASAGWDEVVLDCGFCLEEDEELSFDVPAPQRNAATLAGLGAADRVIAVGTGDPVGLPRLIRGLDELEGHLAGYREGHPEGQSGSSGDPAGGGGAGTIVEIVVNQVRPDVSGVAPKAQIGAVLERFGGDRSVAAYLPWDRRSLDRALLGGQVLAEAAPSSGLRRAIVGLARQAGAAPAPGTRDAGRRRLGLRGRLGRVLRRA